MTTQYDQHRENMRQRMGEESKNSRDIADGLPKIINPERRAACSKSLAEFVMTYFPEGKSPFSDDHKKVIRKMESAIFHGGHFVEAVYRGFGKTTLAESCALWAVLYGYKSFVPLIGASNDMANQNIDSIKGMIESDNLIEDFPDVCYAIQRLEGITQRCKGQLFNGKPTHIEYGSDQIVLPMVAGAYDNAGKFYENKSAGSVIIAKGITAKLRGMKHRRGDGVTIRPDLIIIDDPQDEESAISPYQVEKRLKTINKALLKSAGHTNSVSVIMPCTVIEKDDLVEQLLDPQKNHLWQGERIPIMPKFADAHEDMWLTKYAELRNTYNPDIEGDQERAQAEATKFYKDNRDEMDKGCEVSWIHCFNEKEISAIQHAYNALIDEPVSFFSEFQNQPLVDENEDSQITTELMLNRLNGMKRTEIPSDCELMSMFIDVQDQILYYVVCAWRDNFTGFVVDYGTYPEQGRANFRVANIPNPLSKVYFGIGKEGAWRKAFDVLTSEYLGKQWERDDGGTLSISVCLLDANDGEAQPVIYDFCRQSPHAGIVMPSKGRGIKAGDRPFHEYKKSKGDKIGHNWRIPSIKGKREVRHILSDVNYWKTFTRARLFTAKGDHGSLTVFGKDVNRHQMFIDHMVCEFSVMTEGRGRRCHEWKRRPQHTENHFFDCLVGCVIGANVRGVALSGVTNLRRKKRRVISRNRQPESRHQNIGGVRRKY